MNNKFLFIDRDGTLIEEPKKNFQVDHINKLILEPYVIYSLTNLIRHNFRFVMVTNQDGLGSNNFPMEKFLKPHNFLINLFKSQKIFFDKVFICPHKISDNCFCRKPKTKLVDNFIKKSGINLKKSYVIGDRDTDKCFAKNIGIKSILYDRKKNNWKNIEKFLTKLDRYGKSKRESNETKIKIKVWLDRAGHSNINTKLKFFDHMLHQIAIHAGIKMNILVHGDVNIDDHHTIEDTGIVLGKAILNSLGNKVGINRYGYTLPMDEALANCVLDISGRPGFFFKANFKNQKVGDISTEMIEHFFYSLSYSMGITLHLNTKGHNDHHIAESLFKAFGRTLKKAILVTNNLIPSSKGII
ncbi:bifunctional histidinol-phosphatase/imidazoleglycerol-phosphate dehydratase HisB [Buchnera aphidicola (Taiwanaphis decaspermi)]|uniref:bifunctional histidinol-phosphatase/imidazoleglycerol-phosphate dehydratase HisB n=1 Tax=Buchnera aphidicola TaxID=9 RepID=UPI0031B86B7A